MDKKPKLKDMGNDFPEMEIDKEIQKPPTNIGKGKQVFATIIANISTLAVPVITSTAYPWQMHDSIKLGVVPFAAIFLGLLLSYYLCECYGRKITLRLSAMPLIISCMMIIFSYDYEPSVTAFFLALFGGSMCLFTLPIYVSEISCNSMRGTLGSVRMIFMTIGIALVFFKLGAEPAVIIPFIFIIGMHWMPESPVFLARKSRIVDATRSRIVEGANNVQSTDNKLPKSEQTVEKIPDLESCMSVEVRTINSYFEDPADRRAFIIAFGLLAAQSLWEVERWAWWVGAGRYEVNRLIVFPILASVVATILINFVTRRSLLLISCVGLLLHSVLRFIIACKIIQIYMSGLSSEFLVYMDGYALPILLLSSYYLGLGTVTSVIAVEVFRREVRALGYMICLGASWIVMFIGIWIKTSHVFSSFENILFNRLIQVVLYSYLIFFSLVTYSHVPKTKGRAI